MEFGFSEQQREVQQLAQQILGEQVSADKLASYDDHEVPRFDQALWQQLLSAGLPAVAVAEAHGGMGFGFTELALFIEEAGRSIAPVPVLAHCVGGLLPLQQFGSGQQQERWLGPAARGEVLLSVALTEPMNEDPGSPVLVTATAVGDDLVLDGVKTAVPFASQADRILLAARHDRGVALVLLDPQADGVTLEPLTVTSLEPQAQLTLTSVKVAASDILVPDEGAAAMAWLAQRYRAGLCVSQLGTADAAMRMAASYTSQREQFGVPVATFQAVGHRLADCYIDIECLRLASYQAVSLLDSALDATVELQIAKVLCGDVGHRVSYATQHVHGGMGIDRDYPLWRYCLWLRSNEMTLGCSASELAGLGTGLAQGVGLVS